MRFINETSITENGEVLSEEVYNLSQKVIEEEKYYGFYAVSTNLKGDVRKIIEIHKRR